ncbi:MAG: hypothetical protein MK198_09465 [Gracilimonas sp.]|uniref:hypothetical protein n=1 Tax=Gracilimonas sp. TaxID=1974203 RepID=UPI0037518987|nr:hypothetical protein [Gracilimonas sp.]
MISLLLTLVQKGSDFSTSSKGREYLPPDSPLYYIVLIGASIIVLATIILTIKWFICPGEKSDDHIKRKILDTDSTESQHNG